MPIILSSDCAGIMHGRKRKASVCLTRVNKSVQITATTAAAAVAGIEPYYIKQDLTAEQQQQSRRETAGVFSQRSWMMKKRRNGQLVNREEGRRNAGLGPLPYAGQAVQQHSPERRTSSQGSCLTRNKIDTQSAVISWAMFALSTGRVAQGGRPRSRQSVAAGDLPLLPPSIPSLSFLTNPLPRRTLYACKQASSTPELDGQAAVSTGHGVPRGATAALSAIASSGNVCQGQVHLHTAVH